MYSQTNYLWFYHHFTVSLARIGSTRTKSWYKIIVAYSLVYTFVGPKGTEIENYKITQADRQTPSMMRGSCYCNKMCF